MYPDATLVTEEHRNEVIISIIFRLKPGGEKENNDDRIILKSFVSDIFCDETRQHQLKQCERVVPQMLSANYDISLDHYENISNFNDQFPDFKPYQYPDSDLIFKTFSTSSSVGCQHYICGCLQQCPTCKNFYGCRQCHNEAEDHVLDRTSVTTLKCRFCSETVPFGDKCANCSKQFCSVFCPVCKFMCFIGLDEKPFYHCEQCGTCKVGLKKKWTHCDKCNRCYHVDYFNSHRCGIRTATECCVCLGTLRDSVFQIRDIECGHTMHYHCWVQLINQNNFSCPMCKKCLLDAELRQQIFEHYTQIARKTLIGTRTVQVHCNQCNNEFGFFEQPFYWCHECKSFNTSVVNGNPSTETVKQYIQQLTDPIHCLILTVENAIPFFTEKYNLNEEEIEVIKQGITEASLQVIEHLLRIGGFPPEKELFLALFK
ncbi:RING_finger and CHY zinc finger domain-containing protein [Hexamita inflata]|uniref:RING finger and CHY zinc finger domain-containing protein n=1 Tax=Hexamita inflata TaxID=28002 RepID=A0AA86PY24_9EUKA|nr:RING finger and CHY zinc finger domain-containing protein [Hexamita inflata]